MAEESKELLSMENSFGDLDISDPSTDDKPEPIVFGYRDDSDVTLIVENQEFLVHKATLTRYSDVFEKMLKKANEDRIEIKDVSVTALQRLIELMYYGTLRRVSDRDSLFPGVCSDDFDSFKETGIDEILSRDSGMYQLMEVAKRFNVPALAQHELKDAFSHILCDSENCLRCFTIYEIHEFSKRRFYIDIRSEVLWMIKRRQRILDFYSTKKAILPSDEDVSDVTLIVDRQEFPVHKKVLASHSDVFEELFYANKDRIEIKYVEATAFQRLMEILYKGAMKNRENLFPGRCNENRVSSANFQEAHEKVMSELCENDSCDFYQLLRVAARFKLRELVYIELTEVFREISCRSIYCIRCISIYFVYAGGEDGVRPYHRTFDSETIASVLRNIERHNKEADKFWARLDQLGVRYTTQIL